MALSDIALRYLDIFCSGKDFDELKELFAEDLRFEGPFFQCDSAEVYIERLKSDPPERLEYRVIKVFEDDDSVNVIYEFSKGSISSRMSQLFWLAKGKITWILLIFDSADFA